MEKTASRLCAMVGGFVVLCCSAYGQDLFYHYPLPSGATFQNQIVVSKVVDDTYFSLTAHDFGYGGIQQNSGGSSARVGIFSIWDQNNEEATVVSYNPNLNVKTVGRFGGEGTGVQFLFNYAWVFGRAYRCAFRNYLEPDGQHMRFGCYFYDSSIGSWVYCVTHRANTAGAYPSYMYSFNESYGGITGNRQATVSNAWWCSTAGNWQDLTSGYTTNVPDGSGNYGQVLTSSNGFEYNSSKSPSTYTPAGNVSYTPLPSEAPIYIPYLVSCGNPNCVSGNANGTNAWEPDAYYDSGGMYSTSATISTSGVSNPAPQGVYQSCRYNSAITYTLYGLKPSASYTVRLHFAEIIGDAPGQRLQNVSINGSQVLTNFDINATAGGINKAVVEQFAVHADSTGAIKVLAQVATGSPDWAASINGIDVH